MNTAHVTDRFVGALFFGAICTTVLVCATFAGVDYASSGGVARPAWLIGGTVLFAAVALVAPHLVVLLFYAKSRHPFLLDDEIKAVIVGRLLGVVTGALSALQLIAWF